jgi:hypothetical protein
MPKKLKEVVLTGTVYCDWNAKSEVAALPDHKYWAPGDLVIWSWSGNKKAPSSKKNSGVLCVSVIVGKKRRRLKVKRSGVEANLAYISETGREVFAEELAAELRELKGKTVYQSRWGFMISLQPRKPVPARKEIPAAAPAPRQSEPQTFTLEETFTRPRGRIKPGIRNDVPEPAVAHSPAAKVVAPAVAAVVATDLPVWKKRRRRKPVDSRQGELF